MHRWYNRQMSMKQTINIASREFFQTSLVTYLLLTLAETLSEGFVSNFFNMNYLLLVVLVTGIVMVLTEPPESPVGQAVTAGREKLATVARSVAPVRLRRSVGGIVHGRTQVIDLRPNESQLSPPDITLMPTHNPRPITKSSSSTPKRPPKRL